MKLEFSNFITSEDGAVTVDWVVLCAAVVGLGMIVLTPVAYSADSRASRVGDTIGNVKSGYGNN